jgi:hypothetical protein
LNFLALPSKDFRRARKGDRRLVDSEKFWVDKQNVHSYTLFDAMVPLLEVICSASMPQITSIATFLEQPLS